MNRKKVMVTAAAIVIIFLLFIIFGGGGIPVSAVQSQYGTIRAYVEERAKTSLPRVYHIAMPYDGRITPITLQPGTPVKQGDVIATINKLDLETKAAEARSRIGVIEGNIKISRYNVMEETSLKESYDWIKTFADMLKASAKKVEASEAKNKYSQWYLNSCEKMFSGKAISEKEMNRTQMEASEATIDYETAVLANSAMITMQSIMELLPVYIKQYLERKSLSTQVMLQQLQEAKSGLEKAERDLKNADIKSPINGIVLNRFFMNERFLQAGTVLMDLGNQEEIEITSEILSQEAVNIKPNDPVEIFGPAVGSTSITGTVKRINPEAFTKTSSLGVEEQRVSVIISISSDFIKKLLSEKRLPGVGYRLQVRIFTAFAPKALKIPRTALFRSNDGNWSAFIVSGGKARIRKLQIGIMNDNEAQVLNGISEGPKVIIAPPASLLDGGSVKIE